MTFLQMASLLRRELDQPDDEPGDLRKLFEWLSRTQITEAYDTEVVGPDKDQGAYEVTWRELPRVLTRVLEGVSKKSRLRLHMAQIAAEIIAQQAPCQGRVFELAWGFLMPPCFPQQRWSDIRHYAEHMQVPLLEARIWILYLKLEHEICFPDFVGIRLIDAQLINKVHQLDLNYTIDKLSNDKFDLYTTVLDLPAQVGKWNRLELAVAEGLKRGLTYRQIASELGLPLGIVRKRNGG